MAETAFCFVLINRMPVRGVEMEAVLLTPIELRAWFVDQILPLEAVLERYLRRNWRDADEIADLRQEVYARVFDACALGQPDSAQAFVLSTARNLLIDRARRDQIVDIETFADMDELTPTIDELSPERHLSARSELRLLQRALNLLPERCREAVELRKIEGLSQREVATRMGISEDTVEKHLSKGVRALAVALQATGGGAAAAAPLGRAPLRKGRTTQ
jgi:RNA polymerase sigma factor (sigma-70 family)